MSEQKYKAQVLVCGADFFEKQRDYIVSSVEHCLLYIEESVTYDNRVALCRVYFFEHGDFFLVSPRAKIIRANWASVSEKNNSNELLSITKYGADFVTCLCTRDAYRALLLMADNIAKSLLLEANDAAALYAYKYNSRIHNSLQRGEIYELLLADDEAIYSYLSLNIIDNEDQAKSRKILAIDADLEVAPGVILPVGFNFSRKPVLATLINVIIGANGVGKTRLLKALVSSASNNELKIEDDFDDYILSDYIPVVVFTHEKEQWKKLNSQIKECLSLGSGRSEWSDLSRSLQQLYLRDTSGSFVQIAMNLLGRFVELDQLFFKVIGHKKYSCLSELKRNPELLRELIVTSPLEYRGVDGFVQQLSSGQRVLVCFVVNIVRYCSPRTLVIVDEPENHMHPQFVSLIMEALNSALLATESVAVVVTHSPFVVREVERDGVLILDKRENLPILLRPSLQTLGGDVSLISDYVFGDIDIRKGYQTAIDNALGHQRTETEKREAIAELNGLGSDAASYLRDQLGAGRD